MLRIALNLMQAYSNKSGTDGRFDNQYNFYVQNCCLSTGFPFLLQHSDLSLNLFESVDTVYDASRYAKPAKVSEFKLFKPKTSLDMLVASFEPVITRLISLTTFLSV